MKHKIVFLIVIQVLYFACVSWAQQKILFVMSEADTLLLKEGKIKRQTGVFLNEFYFTYDALIKEGFEVDFATPTGKKPTIDQESLGEDYWGDDSALKAAAVNFWNNSESFSSPITLQKAVDNYKDYEGLIIPGGQGLMVDLIENQNIPILLQNFMEAQKVIGLICHAPILITTIPNTTNPFIGYKVNSVTPFEEFYIEKFIMKGKPKNRKIAKQLKKLGLNYQKGGPGKSYAIRDRNLITSQNPYSSNIFNDYLMKALTDNANKVL